MDTSERISRNFSTPKFYWSCLIILILLLGFIFAYNGWVYISGVMGAVTLFAIERRQMRFLVCKWHFRRSIAATLLILEALFIFLIPIAGIVMMLIDMLSGVNDLQINFDAIVTQVTQVEKLIEQRFGIDLLAAENLAFLPKWGSQMLQYLLSNTYSVVMNGIIILFLLYYMLYNYDDFQQAVRELLPFNNKNKQILLEETDLIIRANAIGIPLLAVIQGGFAYFGYLYFGLSNAPFYAVLTAFATIIPVLGTMIIWIPLAVFMAVQANYVGAIGLVIYGFIIIGGVDNVARFLMQKKLADIHPLITVFGVIIGMSMFGFWGVVFGPLLLSLLALFVNMYRYEYVPGSKASPRISTRRKERKLPIPINLSSGKSTHSSEGNKGKKETSEPMADTEVKVTDGKSDSELECSTSSTQEVHPE